MDEPSVGYKSPPIGTRFRPGQSGNPRGRTKATTSFYDDVSDIFSRPVTGQIAGKSVTVSTPKAMFRGLCRKALRGDRTAMKTVIEFISILAPAPGTELDENGMSAELKAKICKVAKISPELLDMPLPKLTREEQAQRRVEAKEDARKVAAFRRQLKKADAAARATRPYS